MRIGIFGGTFDPVHVGHLIIAEQAREQGRLNEVWFVPSARPPHKADAALTPFDRRAEMLELAIAGHESFRVSLIERDRPGPSFTADTLDELHRKHPDHDWFLIVGADCLPDLPKWHEPRRILERATLLAAARPGWEVLSVEQLAAALDPEGRAPVRLQMITTPQIDLSSRDLRKRAAEQRSIRYLVPHAVEVYIREKRIYG